MMPVVTVLRPDLARRRQTEAAGFIRRPEAWTYADGADLANTLLTAAAERGGQPRKIVPENRRSEAQW